MKNTISKFSIFAFFLIFSLSACKDECDDVNCLNGATCDEGDCNCASGFEGDVCQTETRAKFFGSYNVSENCTPGGNFTYQLSIVTSATGPLNIIINNFYGFGASVSATVSGANITIPNQTVTTQGEALTYSGTGQITGNILTMSYTASQGAASDACSATCTKL